MTEYESCPHGRHIGGVCIPCAEEAGGKLTVNTDTDWEYDPKLSEPSGLDAKYYDIPGHILDCQDLIEWLNLDFANGNILKSIVRENNPYAAKETDELYEAEKRFYFASRHLEKVRRMCKDRQSD